MWSRRSSFNLALLSLLKGSTENLNIFINFLSSKGVLLKHLRFFIGFEGPGELEQTWETCRNKVARVKLRGGQNREKQWKINEKLVFLSSYNFFGFSTFFFGFCKGRISKNTLQMYLKPAKILPLRISSVLTPASRSKSAKSFIQRPTSRRNAIIIF